MRGIVLRLLTAVAGGCVAGWLLLVSGLSIWSPWWWVAFVGVNGAMCLALDDLWSRR